MYNSGMKKLIDGSIDLDSDTIKAMFLTSAYTPNFDSHDFVDDVSGNESSGTGYSAGGPTLANKTVTQDNTNDRAVFDADDIALPTTTIANCRYLALYKDTGNPATSPLIALVDLLATKSTSTDTFKVEWDASGILYLAAA